MKCSNRVNNNCPGKENIKLGNYFKGGYNKIGQLFQIEPII